MRRYLIPLFFISQLSYSQSGLWLDATLTKKWSKSQKTSFEMGHRSTMQKGFDRAYLDLAHEMKLNKWLKVSAVGRLGLNEQKNQYALATDLFALRTQVGFEVSLLPILQIRSKKIDLSWQCRQQMQWQQQQRLESMLRNKVSFSYDIRRNPFTPTLSAEYFYLWNANVLYTPIDVLTSGAGVQWRYFAGGALELGDQHNLKLQVGYRVKASGDQFLYRISYSYNLD